MADGKLSHLPCEALLFAALIFSMACHAAHARQHVASKWMGRQGRLDAHDSTLVRLAELLECSASKWVTDAACCDSFTRDPPSPALQLTSLPACLPSLCPSVHASIHPCVCPSIQRSVHPSTRLSVHASIHELHITSSLRGNNVRYCKMNKPTVSTKGSLP